MLRNRSAATCGETAMGELYGRSGRPEDSRRVSGQRADPDARGSGLAEMQRSGADPQGQRFIVLAPRHRQLCARMKLKLVQKFKKPGILFVNADDLGPRLGVEVRKQHRPLLLELRDAPA